LAMLAAFLAGVPNRIHTLTGQVWANKTGKVRSALMMFDKLIALCATGLLADSFSQRKFLIDQNIVADRKIVVLGYGSVCGVDVGRFKPNVTARHYIRHTLGIPVNAIVYLFLGRLNKDKGIQDLAYAFDAIAANTPDVHLLVVGPDEGGMDIILEEALGKCIGRFHRVGYTDKPESYMACADIFCLPSYREGFGSVIIEAAAAGIPAVASNICGLIDAIVNGETGILHQPKNIEEIKSALLALSNNDDSRNKMARAAQARVHAYFTNDMVKEAMRKYYQAILH
jgi:glycosyltransferase involved in cell wall biosynthesis